MAISEVKQNRIKVIGFDLDGTLYPMTPEIQERIRIPIYKNLAQALGIQFEEAKILFDQIYEKQLSGTRTIQEIGREYQQNLNAEELMQTSIEEADFLDLLEPNLSLQEMLFRISKKRSLDILTGSTQNQTMMKLNRLRIPQEYFGHIIADAKKISGKSYHQWLSLRGFSPDEFLYVGDNTRQDIEVPKKLGIKTCFVGRKSCKEAYFCMTSILDLEKVLASSTPADF